MILNTGQRTDIPAFYTPWFLNRLREGFVLVRNPINPQRITRYTLSPDTIDLMAFCTKNPAPMLPHLEKMKAFRMLWHVTITPYGKEIEPNVPDKEEVLTSCIALADALGRDRIIWRYDPVFISRKYSVEYHKKAFAHMAERLGGHTNRVIFSFIDLYEKTKKNFPEARPVRREERMELGESFADSARRYGIEPCTCMEGAELGVFGVETAGCFTQADMEKIVGMPLKVPSTEKGIRGGCACLLGHDIGAYNTCRHFCRYCYANYDRKTVLINEKLHDPDSPLLVGHVNPEDIVTDARQVSWIDGQMTLPLL